MNRELFAIRPEEKAEPVLEAILEFGITAVPVLDATRKPVGVVSLRDLVRKDRRSRRMTTPAATVAEGASIPDAGRALVAANVHHLVVVDEAGRATGMLSAMDVVRGLLGIPAQHPRSFPHRDERFGVTWTDDRELRAESAADAPNAAGVLVLSEGGLGRVESVVWAESCGNMRARVDELLGIPQTDSPLLAKILARSDLRYRCAVVPDRDRAAVIAAALSEVASHLPLPSSSALEGE